MQNLKKVKENLVKDSVNLFPSSKKLSAILQRVTRC